MMTSDVTHEGRFEALVAECEQLLHHSAELPAGGERAVPVTVPLPADAGGGDTRCFVFELFAG
ncbi:MAG: hypothetical protein V8T86_00125 [Victivallis sp.]